MTDAMPYGKIPGLDKPVSRLIQGAIMLDPNSPESGFALLDEVFDLGCNTFDTAHIYGGGSSERMLGDWIRTRGNRDQVAIITKGAHPNVDRARVTSYDIASDLHDSLARLQVDCIDIYLLHRDDPRVPAGEIVEILNEHRAAGRIRAFGGSNWTYERIAECNAYARAHGLEPFTASSPNFSLAEMVAEPWGGCLSITGAENAEARRWYASENMPVLSWSSLARGFFAGNIRRDNLDSMKPADRGTIHAFLHESNFQRLDRAEKLARAKGVSVTQIALAYVANTPLNLFALVGCYSGKEFQECRAAWNMALTAQEMDWLDLQSDMSPIT